LAFSCKLLLLITSCSYKSGIPPALPPSLVPQIKAYISTSDISLLSQALSTLALLLELSPSVTFPQVERGLLNDIYIVAHSPLVAGVALDSLFRFFSALVQADNQIATHVVPNLVISAEKAPKAESSSPNVAKCIGHVVRSQLSVAAGTIAEYAKHIKV
jgi:cullin-associated NEDD8-dissociated protein 1